MPLRLNRKQLVELIEEMEAKGNDATALRQELAALEPEEKPGPSRRGLKSEDREETSEERLIRRKGHLFLGTPPFKEIYDYDYRFNKNELIEQCRKAGIGVSGDKHDLAAELLAKTKGTSAEIHIERESTDYIESEEGGPPFMFSWATYPLLYKEVLAVIKDIGHVTYTYYPKYELGHVQAVRVHEPYLRRGFGRKLLQFALDDMREKDIKWVSASVLSKEGEELLQAVGFRPVGPGVMLK